MNHKALLGTAVAAALMFGAQAVSACSSGAWSSATGIGPGDTGEPTAGFSRTSGRCSMQINGGATPRMVVDSTPQAESTYLGRFYFFTGDISGSTSIFQARNTGGTNIINIVFDGNQISVNTTSGGTQNIVVQDNRYYAIEFAWAAGAGTGSLTGTITGAGSDTPAGTFAFTGLANSGDSIDEARMGLITGSPVVSSSVFFDEFDSRRTTAPGLLCRGDANGNGSLTGGDAQAVINEVVNGVLAIGQPDANQNGLVTGGDAQAIINMVVNLGASCN